MKRILSLILAALMALFGVEPGQSSQQSRREESFPWTLTAQQLNLFDSAQGCMDYLRENVQDPFLSGEIGEDGSLTLTMTESQRQAILDHCRGRIEYALEKYDNGSKVRIEVTNDYRELHVYCMLREYPAFAYLDAGVGINMFSLFCPEDYGEFRLYMHNADTEKVLGTSDMANGSVKVDERKWADSYVLTPEEAEAYTQGRECRDWVIFEDLAIPDSYILLMRALPQMVTEDYSYLYLDQDHHFHLGLTPEQEEKTAEKLDGFLESFRKSLEAEGVRVEMEPDLRACRIFFPEGETYSLNHYTVLVGACLLAQKLENPGKTPFVKADIYEGDTFLGTADTENGIPQGVLPDALVLEKNK